MRENKEIFKIDWEKMIGFDLIILEFKYCFCIELIFNNGKR